MTLLLAFCLAVARADSGVTFISPFVGRIYDWFKTAAGVDWDEAANAGSNDQGVRSVARIYRYYKQSNCNGMSPDGSMHLLCRLPLGSAGLLWSSVRRGEGGCSGAAIPISDPLRFFCYPSSLTNSGTTVNRSPTRP